MNRTCSLISVFLILISSFAYAQINNEKMWVELKNASETADFRINLPFDGCLAILCKVPGRQQTDRIWGPRHMKKGVYRLPLPQSRVSGKSGTVELFNVELKPIGSIGSRGNGERQFNSPMGLDFDNTRNEILVADTGNDRIIRLSHDGRFIAQHGGFGLSFGDRSEEREDSLDDPYDVAAGGFSNFYVSDHNNERIANFDSYRSYRGNLYPKDNDRRNRLSRPKGIKVDSENNIWVVESRQDRVLKISSTGDKLFEIGGFGWSSQQLKNPHQVDISNSGEVYIADHGKGRVAVFDRLGSFLFEVKDHLKSPAGIAVDPDGLLLICDDSTDQLGYYLPSGVRMSFVSTDHTGNRFRKPSDIAVTNTSAYLVDSGNHRIVQFDRIRTGVSVSWQATSPVLE